MKYIVMDEVRGKEYDNWKKRSVKLIGHSTT